MILDRDIKAEEMPEIPESSTLHTGGIPPHNLPDRRIAVNLFQLTDIRIRKKVSNPSKGYT